MMFPAKYSDMRLDRFLSAVPPPIKEAISPRLRPSELAKVLERMADGAEEISELRIWIADEPYRALVRKTVWAGRHGWILEFPVFEKAVHWLKWDKYPEEVKEFHDSLKARYPSPPYEIVREVAPEKRAWKFSVLLKIQPEFRISPDVMARHLLKTLRIRRMELWTIRRFVPVEVPVEQFIALTGWRLRLMPAPKKSGY